MKSNTKFLSQSLGKSNNTMSKVDDEKEKLLGSGSDKNAYGSTPKKEFCEKHDPNQPLVSSISGYLFDRFFQTENSRTSIAPCCACGTCNHDECAFRKRIRDASGKSDGHSHSHSHAHSLERSNSFGSIGSYNNPATPTRSRTNSSDSASLKMDPTIDQTIVRSTILCKGICCSSEVPELLEILTPIKGIAEVKVNVPLKHIMIDHDSRVISATQIVQRLEEELFPSTVQRDGGASLPSIVRSTFATKGLCCSSEVPMILDILTPYNGISDVKVIVPVRQVIVSHDCKIISAAQIATILTKEEFATKVESDGGASGKVAGVEGRSKFHVGGICCSSEIPAIRDILEPINGVTGLLVTVATKMVRVSKRILVVIWIELLILTKFLELFLLRFTSITVQM